MDHLDRLNQKLRNRERIFGYTIYLPNTYMQMEYMPQGVDYVLFDCEHGPHDEDSYAAYYRHFRALGIPTITRIADAEYHLAARAMDCGSDGLLIPRVETMEQVRAAVETLTEEALTERGVRAKKIEVETDISTRGDIYIQHVTLVVDKQNVPIAKAVGEVLTKQWEVPVEVTTEEGSD